MHVRCLHSACLTVGKVRFNISSNQGELVMHKFVIRGTRGSLPVCDRRYLRYGGNTTCFSIDTDHGVLIFDAGTGISSVGRDLSGRNNKLPICVLFTHFHLDHIIGLPGFAPLHDPHSLIRFMGDPNREDDWHTTLSSLFSKPYWPASLMSGGATKCFESLPMDRHSIELFGLRISWCPVFHPQGCLSYKIQFKDTTIVIATDHEHTRSDLCSGFLGFCEGADILIYDAMYTPAEYTSRVGWGHGNWQQGVQLAIESGVGELILTHHEASRTDSEIDEIVMRSREFFPQTRAATDNMVLSAGD